ncbi:hypothetical protein L4D76_24705 [Photobacterium sagamiensis]|uniref:hypothetical protein n=1 Tax=Photobacterium sagamiensis TaxID=2910241 RepID=UPI003D0EF338
MFRYIICLVTLCLNLNFANASEICTVKHNLETGSNYAFDNSLIISKEISRELCKLSIGEKTHDHTLDILVEQWKKSVSKEAKFLLTTDADGNIAAAIDTFASYIAKQQSIGITVDLLSNSWYVRKSPDDSNFIGGKFNEQNNLQCKDNSSGYGKECIKVMADFEILIEAAFTSVTRQQLTTALTKIGFYSEQWDNYFYDARSLTPWELMLNTQLYKEELIGNDFVLPPSYQYFLLHPSAVIEHVSDAPDGDQQKAALSLEWVGINAWNWKVPLGISVVSTYADRAQVSDIRHGVMLHVYNNYSIGWVGIGDDDPGVFVNFDILKMLKDTSSRRRDYQAKIEGFLRVND